ncbi:MAG: GDP-mannose dehydrogenase [Verrucomicrobiales bacterium]|nr:GDP-mannose dehydrogenase [Verrucomicrobiales bacterium]
MNISVIGLGYVGAVTAGCLSHRGHKIAGVETQGSKVELCNSGKPSIAEAGLTDLLQQAKALGLLSATMNGEEAVLKSEASIITKSADEQCHSSLGVD